MATGLNKWLVTVFFPLLFGFICVSFWYTPSINTVVDSHIFHPFHVSVVEVNANKAEKSLEISCKIFTDDFEKILAKNYKAKTDLINPPNKAAMDSLVKKYILSHLSIKVNGKPVGLSYVGFEHEEEAVYSYIEVLNVPVVTKLDISTNLMYDMFDDQMNIMHITVGGKRISNRLNYPDKEVSFAY